MKIPRDLAGKELVKHLKKFGYKPSHQTGSHVRLTRFQNNEEFHITIPLHKPLKIGTLNSILNELSLQLKISKEDILLKL